MDKNQDVAEYYANFMRDYDTSKNRKEEDEAYRIKQNELTEEMYDISDSQTVRRAKDGLNKLQQSIAYMGSM